MAAAQRTRRATNMKASTHESLDRLVADTRGDVASIGALHLAASRCISLHLAASRCISLHLAAPDGTTNRARRYRRCWLIGSTNERSARWLFRRTLDPIVFLEQAAA
jgi:hypothetical protein